MTKSATPTSSETKGGEAKGGRKTCKENTGRRDFIRTGTMAMGVFGLGCLRTPLKEALVQAQQAGKPLLLPQNLNSFIVQNQTRPAEQRLKLAAEAKADVKAFIRQNFHLMPEQEAGLDSLTNRQIEVIKMAIDKAAKGTRVQVGIVGKGATISDVSYREAQTTGRPTTQDPKGGSGDTISVDPHCGEIDSKTGKVKDCGVTITITRK
jgi:hypothetical protein